MFHVRKPVALNVAQAMSTNCKSSIDSLAFLFFTSYVLIQWYFILMLYVNGMKEQKEIEVRNGGEMLMDPDVNRKNSHLNALKFFYFQNC